MDNVSVTLYQGDCLQVMERIPDGSVDMVLVDPPFGMTQNDWDKPIPFDPMWKNVWKVCKENAAVLMFGMEPFSSKLRLSQLKYYKYDYVWNKHIVTGFLNAKKQPLRCTEIISVFYRKQCTYNPIMRKGAFREKGKGGASQNYGKFKSISVKNDTYYPTNILEFPTIREKGDSHPTQKPVSVLEYLIRTYTNSGDTVLDFTMGSGSTGVAAVNTGRNFIGIELDEHYFNLAERRIQEAQDTLKIEGWTE